jgi:NAD(P)-dependent dehydrogenase (short-subunit alcohol dehydrogenase family)
MVDLFSLEGRTVVVTGACGHLGVAISTAIAKAGAHLILTGRSEAKCKGLQDLLTTQYSARVDVQELDVLSEESLKRFSNVLESNSRNLHGIVNNAYAGIVGTAFKIPDDQIDLAFRYSVSAPLRMYKILYPFLADGARALGSTSSIVNIASMYGKVSPYPEIYGDTGNNNPVHYGAAKAAMIQMTKYMACHFGHLGIRSNSVSPGPFPAKSKAHGVDDFYAKLSTKVPLKRIGEASEIGPPVVFLLSDAASYVNGHDLAVDGGWTAW